MQNQTQKQILSHATIIATFTVLSKILGLLRDRFLASEFGAGPVLDAYYAAFRVPDFIFNLLVLGTVSAAFVPVFLSYVSKKQLRTAFEIANSVLNSIVVVMVVLAGIALVFTEPLINIIAPGFDDPEIIDLAVRYMRWMLLSPIIFGISSVLSGILNAYRKFIAYSLAPVLYNLGIIIGIVALVPFYGPIALAYGVVIGAVLHLLVQIPSTFRVGYRWRPSLKIKSPGFQKVIRLMIPRMVGFAALQLSLVVTVAIATTLDTGSTTVYNLALNLQYFPITIFGISIATAVFPVLAMAASKQDFKSFRENFSLSFRKILFFIIPASIMMLILRAHIVRIVLGTGAFDWEDTILTLETLGFFTLSLFAQALIPLLTRTFYAIQNTKIPVAVGVTSMIMNIILSFTLAPIMGVSGLALAFTIASIFNAVVLLMVLRHKVGNLNDQEITSSAFKTIIAALLMGLVMSPRFGLLKIADSFLDTHTYLGITFQATIAIVGGIVIYLLLQKLLKNPELDIYMDILSSRKKKKDGHKSNT
ncbi:murein biosynthesis integral membrane protein MurJ [Patescibacteria group bacterium]